MSSKGSKQLSNPFSTGGGGVHFEAHVQASFVALMLSGGCAPCLPCWPIKEIKLQGRIDGYNTDDLIVVVEKSGSDERRKLLGQVKHAVSITKGDKVFSEVIQAAWDDFNNPRVFSRGKDVIALITGPLSATDFHSVQWLSAQARHTKNADEFYRRVEQARFSSAKSREKLEAIQHHLRLANHGVEVSKENVYSFLNDFRLLGYDLGKEGGVVLSLMHSHISQFNRQYPQQVWSAVVDVVQEWNQDAGTITLEKLPEHLIGEFKQPTYVHIPAELTKVQPSAPERTDWSHHDYAVDLSLVNLVGAWNEKSQPDINILASVIGETYSTWVSKARDMLQLSDKPLSLQNGQWKITDRVRLWNELGSRIFDQHLDAFRSSAVSALREPDPSFELPREERFAASIHGKVLTHSPSLRKGLAEGLALLGTRPTALVNCSRGKAEATVALAVREILADADWMLWGSLSTLLPILAEAAPEEFINAVESALGMEPCPFDELFSQEGDGITGSNYLSGLLWALEGLAWDEKYLVHVCALLGDLANRDPGGKWANRPAESLSTILLPWFPQTLAPIEKRKVAVQVLRREWPKVAWKVLVSLLPNHKRVSTGSYKPVWRTIIPEGWKDGVSNHEYWEQISSYADLTVEMARHDVAKLGELIDQLGSLTKSAFDQLLQVLSDDSIAAMPEDARLPLWDKLIRFSLHHRRFSSAEWALDETLLSSIDVVAAKLAPVNPMNLYRHLFSGRDSDLYEHNGNWEEQRRKLDGRRQEAVRDILQLGGIHQVLQFVEGVESPGQVGQALGGVAGDEIDSFLLPAYLGTENHKPTAFITAYVRSRHYTTGWWWADHLDKAGWSPRQIGQFLGLLPFTPETWARAAEWLGDSQEEYWLATEVNSYQSSDLGIAVDKLTQYGRPHAAITCLFGELQDKQPLNVDQCVRALLAAVTSSEPTASVDAYAIVELIKALQGMSGVSQEDLFRVEWAYLPILDDYPGTTARLLEHRLASNPDFFCQVIRLLYRSKKADATPPEPSEETKKIAENAWKLLHGWRIPPGMQNGGGFVGTNFSSWLIRVKELCTESGHLEVALITIGEVLVHCPPDADGLWIDHAVAEALNAREAEDMRRGFSTGIYNSRGAHWVDPTGKPERELAEQYRRKADDVENAGYHRLAATLRELADRYDTEADFVLDQFKSDDDE